MKNFLVISFICAALMFSCGKKIMPGAQKGNQSKNAKSEKSVTDQPDQHSSATSTPSFNNMQRTVPPPMESPRNISVEKGKTVYVTKCGNCHALKNPGDYTEDQLNNILKIEIPKANLDNKEAEQVTAYLLANAKK
ncbi:MAG: hypothetical protein ACRDEB_00010 [Chitinophagaceae bacterium]